MERIIAMIPARIGSKRISKKNIRLINGKPLIAYIIEAAIESQVFDEIYINSECKIFENIANEYGIKFYKRPEHLSSDSATNDDFVLDFLENKNCDVLIQLLATSPFISPKEIKNFVQKIKEDNLDTLISVKNEQIECIYDKKPINFIQKSQTLPSQLLKPIQVYACGIMGWRAENYKQNILNYGSGYHGGDGKIDFFQLKGYANIDIDNEEDFQLAEVIAKLKKEDIAPPSYYATLSNSESDVPSILKKDGIIHNNFDAENLEISNIKKIINKNKKFSSWSHRIINTENNSATLICQSPGEGNRLHYHSDWNEWWYIIDGLWEFEIEGSKKNIKKNDIVFIEKGKLHKITAIGDTPAIRLAVSRQDVAHIYEDEDSVIYKQKLQWAHAVNSHNKKKLYGYEYGDPNSSYATADGYSHLGNYKKIKNKFILKFLNNEKTILEIGSLEGKWTQFFLKAKKVICVDIIKDGFKKFIKKFPKSNIEFYHTKGYELSGIPDKSVDIVFSMDSLMRSGVDIIEKYISESYRVIKDDGKICLHLPCSSQAGSIQRNFVELSIENINQICLKNNIIDFEIDTDTIRHGVLLKIGYGHK